MKDYKLIIFDCDGTLVDSETITNMVLAELFEQMGIGRSYGEIRELFMGKSMNDILDYIKANREEALDFDFVKTFRGICNERFKTELKVFDGVYQLLDRIDQKMCIASNGPREKMDVTLKATKLDQYFKKEDIFSAYDYQKWKPDPTLFNEVLAFYNVKKEEALVIEDSISGVDGAINAGIDVIVFSEDKVDPKIIERKVPVYNTMKSIENVIFAH